VQKAMIEAAAAAEGYYWVRDPFGGVLKVSLGLPTFTRTPGTGGIEHMTGSIAYTEVS
jgi:hypothetical protein